MENKENKEIKEIKEILQKIAHLVSNLKSSDYQAIKFSEGELSEEKFAPVREQRRAWRAEINELQAELKTYCKGESEK